MPPPPGVILKDINVYLARQLQCHHVQGQHSLTWHCHFVRCCSGSVVSSSVG